MAHYAFLDENNIVIGVIPGKDEGEDGIDWEEFYSKEMNAVCKRTSYNTYGGVHNNGGVPFRKNYAGMGFTYDETRDAFIAPKPHPSWILNEDSCIWEPPIPYPDSSVMTFWDEESLSWIEVNH
jgi:hypothetical protein